jgi:hypothetical protein
MPLGPRRAPSEEEQFDYACSIGFLRDFDAVLKKDPALADHIEGLIHRILAGPYEPGLIASCSWINDENDLFRLKVGDSVLLEWRVRPKEKVWSFNVQENKDWIIKFLRIVPI